MSVQIPAGDYVLDQGVIVKVVVQGSKRLLQFKPDRTVEIKAAAFGVKGWTISCRLFQNDFTGLLTKKPVAKNATLTPVS